MSHLELLELALEQLDLALGGAELLGQARVVLERLAQLHLQGRALAGGRQAALHRRRHARAASTSTS